jgi:predicted RNA-binding protein with PIN domain
VGTLVVDGNNVMGARPDGWWRNKPAAVKRLLARVQCYARQTGGDPTVLVLDVVQSDLREGDHDGVTVRYATRKGRDAADDRIRELVAELEGDVEVVTSDRALRADMGERISVTGAGTFLRRLDDAGC